MGIPFQKDAIGDCESRDVGYPTANSLDWIFRNFRNCRLGGRGNQ